MKRLWRKDTDKNTDRYDIEKHYNKLIKTAYNTLNDLNKAYDLLTKNAEANFEQKERAFAKEKQQIETTFNQKIETLKQNQTDTLHKKNDAIKKIEQSIKENTKALSLDFKKSSLLLEDDIKALQEERKLKFKEIEKYHKTNTSIFQEKLDLFQENLRKNQAETKARLLESIEALKEQQATFKANKEPIFNALENDLETFEEAIENSFKREREGTSKHTKRLLNNMTNYRKEFNALIKNITTSITESRIALEAPFIAYKQTLQSMRDAFNKEIDTINDTLKLDFDFEKQRIENLLKSAPENPLDPKEVKDLNARLKLATLRKDTLIAQNQALSDLVIKTLDNTDAALTDEQKAFSEIFEHQTLNLKTNHNRFKELFSLIESHIQDIASTTHKASEATHLKSTYNALKTFIADGFDALSNFEIERLNNHIYTTEKLIDVFLEIDDLTLFLDSVEPRKEIEISKQKLSIEQADISLRLDMREAKLTHDLTLMDIKHQARVKEQELLGKMKLLKEIEQRDNLVASHKHDLSNLQADQEYSISKAMFTLRKNHFERDITLLTERKNLEIKQAEQENAIDTYTVEREAALERDLIGSELEEKTLKHRYQIDTLKQSLELAIEKKQKLETVETENHNLKVNELNQQHEQTQHQLQDDIAEQKNALKERLAFIDRALEKETEQPKNNIKEIYAMITHQHTLLEDHSDKLFTTINNYDKNLTDPEAKLRSVLVIISDPFKKQLEAWINKAFAIYQDSLTFVHEVFLERIKQEETTERKQQLQRQKAINEHEKRLQKLEKQQEQLKIGFDRRLEDAKKRISSLETTTLKNLKNILSPYFAFIKDNVFEEHRLIKTAIHDTYDTLNTQDKALVARAKSNHKKAHEQAHEKHVSVIEPLKQALKNNDIDHEEKIKSLDALLATKKQERTEPLRKQIDSLRVQIQTLEKEKTAIEQSSDDAMKDIEDTLENQKAALKNNLDNHLENLHAQYDKKIKKLKERLIDAENILNYETRMHDNRVEHHENLKQEALQTHQQATETKILDFERQQKIIQADKEKALQKAKENLDKQNEGFENAMLASTPRLEAKIEETSRKIDREASLKSDRRKTLIEQTDETWKTLHKQNEKAASVLAEHLENASQNLLKNFKTQATAPLKSLISLQNTFVDTLIKKTIDDIISRD